ncbi:MAG: 4'-phosphopantetheinyl transferase superfamily protein [Prochlorococcus sp.]|nr:4'-phosphopantetheinyl transferase superfamily protein [Prochlorococcaceae cyanobacterium Fu_MAG_50]
MWLFQRDTQERPISEAEQAWARRLPESRSRQFRQSRGSVRSALAELWNLNALEVPLHAPPGKPPTLASGWGCVSFSHCRDALLVGWSPQRLGVDIERADRSIPADQLSRRFFCSQDRQVIVNLEEEEMRAAVLNQWLIKEAAIKWQRGSIAADLIHWQCDLQASVTFHRCHGYRLRVQGLCHGPWTMALAVDVAGMQQAPMVCLV